MAEIKIHVLHTGRVCVAPGLPFGGDNCSILKASGIGVRKSERLWLPVSVYYIEHPKGKILVDCGWSRDMSPNGKYDHRAQIRSLGSPLLYFVNQGIVGFGETAAEQLKLMGIAPSDLDYVLLTHLDCDHANGLSLFRDAGNIFVSEAEIQCVKKKSPVVRTRYQRKWWEGTGLRSFAWNGTEGPAGKSFDLFGDKSVQMINIPGHCDGLCAVKITGRDGRFVLLFSDGGYASKSWREMITSGICMDKVQQQKSLEWIREQSQDERCVESLANHDPDVIPHTILL